MKNKTYKILSISILLAFSGLANAGDKTGDLKSSATIESTCLISANQIGFGAVATPLMMQSSQSDMTVKCSNAVTYTIDLAYGGIYGSSSPPSGYTISYSSYAADSIRYYVFNSSGANIGSMNCGYGSSSRGYVFFSNTIIANLYGAPSSGWNNNAIVKACISDNTLAGTKPVGWTGSYNSSGSQAIGGSAYNYGVMNGGLKGDKLAYSIQVPGEPTKVWNAGNNSYKSTGNGDNQTIPMIAKIVPESSSSKYPAPDMYLDTVTAIISY